MRTTYRWDGRQFVDKRTGKPVPDRYPDAISMPYVCSDLPDYESPVTGKIVSGRAARREDLKRSGCVPADGIPRSRGYKNERFAKRYGLPLNPELTGKDEPNTHVGKPEKPTRSRRAPAA